MMDIALGVTGSEDDSGWRSYGQKPNVTHRFASRKENNMIIIRADANPNIGMGHIMRCLSVADAASSSGHKVTFILADDGVEGLVNERGYEAIVLHTDYKDMESEVWPEIAAELIIVDSYYVTKPYLEKLRLRAPLVYIDDILSFPYPVDILVNYNAYAPFAGYHELYENSGVEEPHLILGTTYAPLRAMFRGLSKKEQKRDVENVLISTGGSDVEHVALRIVEAQPTARTYHLLLGNMNEDKEEIRKLAGKNIVLHENVTDMKTLICSMDLAVSAAGSTLYEICACGVPLITYVLADNQIPGAQAFERLGLAINLGDMREVEDPSKLILSSIEMLAYDYERRVEVGQKMQSMIDGFGADRMVEEIMKTT